MKSILTFLIVLFCATQCKSEPMQLQPGTIADIFTDSSEHIQYTTIKVTSIENQMIHFVENEPTYTETSDSIYDKFTGSKTPGFKNKLLLQDLHDSVGVNFQTFVRKISYDSATKLIHSHKMKIQRQSQLFKWEYQADSLLAKQIPEFNLGEVLAIGIDSSKIVVGKIMAIDRLGIHLLALDTTKINAIKNVSPDLNNLSGKINSFISPHVIFYYLDLRTAASKGLIKHLRNEPLLGWERMVYFVWKEHQNGKINENFISKSEPNE